MPLHRYPELRQSLRRLKQRFRRNEISLVPVPKERGRPRLELGGKRVRLALRRHDQQPRISDDCRRCDGAAQADMQSHHRALAEADERERLRWQPMTRQLGIDEALQYRGRFVDADPALIWIAKGQSKPLASDRRLPASFRGVRRDERRVRQQRLPGAADLDQIVAVGAIAVEKNDELPRGPRSRTKPRAIKLGRHRRLFPSSWSGSDIRYPVGRELVKRMSNPKLHEHLYLLVVH